MLSISQALHDARKSQDRPLVLLLLETAYGKHAFSDVKPTNEMLGLTGANLAGGGVSANGDETAGSGSLDILTMAHMVKSFGTLRESLEPDQGEMLAGLAQDEAGTVTVVLNNTDDMISKMEAQQGLLNARAEIKVGWPSCAAPDFLIRFKGRVQSYKGYRDYFSLDLVAV